MTASPIEQTMESEFESDEEERFFSQPPGPEDDSTSPSVELPVPLSVTEADSSVNGRILAHVIERRARFRRRVALWLGLGSSLILLTAAWRHRNEARSALVASRAVVPVVSPASSIAPALPSSPASFSAAAPVVSPASSVAPALPSSPASFSAPAPSADVAELLARTSKHFAAGRTREGLASARAAIDADPLDARAYLLLAAGLEDLGDWPGARSAFRECQKRASRGPFVSCAYFAGH